MVSSGLMICSFYLKKRGHRGFEVRHPLNAPYTIGDGRRTYTDVFDMLCSFCEKHVPLLDDEDAMKVFSIKAGTVTMHNKAGSYRAMTFTISSGSYGIESSVTDRHTKEEKYKKTQDDADVKDFNCLVFVPEDDGEKKVTKGIMIFQTIAMYGVKMISTKQMRKFFGEAGLTFETCSVSVGAFMEKLIERGSLFRLSLIRNRISPDSSDNIVLASGREEKIFHRPQLNKRWQNKLLKYARDPHSSNILEMGDNVYEDIKVTFKFNGGVRTVSMRDIDKYSVVEDVPQSIFHGGHVDREELIAYMIGTAREYADRMVLTTGGEDLDGTA